MKATLTFTLPEENTEFKLATKAGEMYCGIEELRNYIRKKLKHEEMNEVERNTWELVENAFYDCFSEVLE